MEGRGIAPPHGFKVSGYWAKYLPGVKFSRKIPQKMLAFCLLVLYHIKVRKAAEKNKLN